MGLHRSADLLMQALPTPPLPELPGEEMRIHPGAIMVVGTEQLDCVLGVSFAEFPVLGYLLVAYR